MPPRLSLAGVYRPPLAALGAGLDRAVFHKVADATVRPLLARVADVLGPAQEPAGVVQGTDMTGGRRAPGSGGNVLARLPSGERIRLTVIEYDVSWRPGSRSSSPMASWTFPAPGWPTIS